jgi:hypothetical protein
MTEPGTDTERLSLAEWDRVVEALERFADRTTRTDGEVSATFGNAHIELHRDGTVSAGMPMHEFSADGDVTLLFDHDAGEFHVTGEGVGYTFRRP